MSCGSTGAGAPSIQGSGHSMISSTPGSRAAASRPRGPQSSTTRPAYPATARMAGPVTRTSPAESLRTTSTVPVRRGDGPATRAARRRIRSTAAGRSAATCPAAATSAARVVGVGTRIAAAPAAAAAAWSASMSPTSTQRSGVVPSARAAACTMPGAGLRQPQPARSSCGQYCQVSKGPSSSSTRALTARSWAVENSPRASPDWLVTTPRRRPAARSRSSAARAPGTGRTLSGSPL